MFREYSKRRNSRVGLPWTVPLTAWTSLQLRNRENDLPAPDTARYESKLY